MFSPEVQRLREVRLCNINSLCITGSSNTNRFEHSVGTAYLATLNITSPEQRHLHLPSKTKEVFVIAALLHDVANGPFGHSYEYIMEKKGFIPEQGLNDVFTDVVSVGTSSHKNSSPFETIYFGKLRELRSILSSQQKQEISDIIAGKHPLSKLISDSIDLDNIDNVFRMAYHMGISFRREAPIKLAENLSIKDGLTKFNESVLSYLEEWYSVRKKVYKLLLLNPQEFAGKYMLTEAMDILFECISQGKTLGQDIKWNFSDYELMEELYKLKEVWLKRKNLLCENIDTNYIGTVINLSSEEQQKTKLKKYLEGLELSSTIKEKGKTGETNQLELSDNFSFSHVPDGTISITNRNVSFEISGSNLYKIVNTRLNPAQIISRLMTGDLYHCLLILETADISKYRIFLNYSERITIEDKLESVIRSHKEYPRVSIGIHPILDVNKTERQLSVLLKGSSHSTLIGETSSRKLLIGIFIKNDPFGLKHVRTTDTPKYDMLKSVVIGYFETYFEGGVNPVPLYKEGDEFGEQ